MTRGRSTGGRGCRHRRWPRVGRCASCWVGGWRDNGASDLLSVVAAAVGSIAEGVSCHRAYRLVDFDKVSASGRCSLEDDAAVLSRIRRRRIRLPMIAGADDAARELVAGDAVTEIDLAGHKGCASSCRLLEYEQGLLGRLRRRCRRLNGRRLPLHGARGVVIVGRAAGVVGCCAPALGQCVSHGGRR